MAKTKYSEHKLTKREISIILRDMDLVHQYISGSANWMKPKLTIDCVNAATSLRHLRDDIEDGRIIVYEKKAFIDKGKEQ